jgi:hypothetical protein
MLLCDLEARLPQAVRTRLWHAASQLTQNSDLGIHVAEGIEPGALRGVNADDGLLPGIRLC